MSKIFTKKLSKGGEKGLTLIEILIASFLLAIGVMALVSSLMTSYKTFETGGKAGQANRVLGIVLAELHGYRRYDTLYNDFRLYDGATRKFYVLEDMTIVWPNGLITNGVSNGKNIIGEGWMTFVNSEQSYKTTLWGTSTSWATQSNPPFVSVSDTDGDGVADGIDLNGDGFATNDVVMGTFTIGRTIGSPNLKRYLILPVWVTATIYGENGNDIVRSRQAFLVSSAGQ